MWSTIDYQQVQGFYRPKPSGGGGFSITPLTALTAAKTATPTGTITYGTCNILALAIWWGPPGTSVTISSLTVGGQTLGAISGAIQNSGSNGSTSDIWFIANPTGTSGAVSLTLSGAINNGCFIKPYAINTTTLTPIGGGNSEPAGLVTSTSASISNTAGGAVIGIGCGADPTACNFITGLTGDDNETWAGQFVNINGESGHVASVGGSLSVSFGDPTATNSLPWSMSLASFAP